MSLQFGNAAAVTAQRITSTSTISTPSNWDLSTYAITMSIWFYSNRTTGREPLMCMNIDDNTLGAQYQYGLTILSNATATSRRVEAAHNDGTTGVSRAQAGVGVGWQTNTWTHACGVFPIGAGSRTAYLNANNSATNSTAKAGSNFTDPTFFVNSGESIALALYGHDGSGQVVRLAEAAAWKTALTTDEIVALSKGVKPKLIRPTDLVFYMPLVRATGSSISDETGINPGTATNFGTNYTPTTADHLRRYG